MTSTVLASAETLLATPDAFRAWLLSLGTASYVGERADPCACPLAHFLVGHGVEEVLVGGQSFYENVPDYPIHEMPLPSWAQAFVEAVDDGSWEPITASECVAVLERLAREEALQS